LETWTERVAAPSNARSVEAGAAQKGIIEHRAYRSKGRKCGDHGAAGNGEEGLEGKTVFGEEAVRGGPVLELRAGGGE
jgi:hypothetical protein